MSSPSYLDLYVTDAGAGHKIYVIGVDNSIVGTEHHFPWFAAFSKTYVSKGKNALRVTQIPGKALVYRRRAFLYVVDPAYKVFKVDATNRAEVPELAKSMLHGDDRAGLYNVRYEVRVAYDLSKYKLLGFDTPLIFKSNKEMIEELEKAVDTISNLKVMAIDIEVLSKSGGFPKKGDPILSISYATFRLKDNIFLPNWIDENVKSLVLSPGESLEAGSKHLVKELFDTILSEKPNVIVTFNGIAFDIPYLKPHVADRNIVLESTTIGVLNYAANNLYLVPHVDLAEVREYLGSAMGLRSQVAFALDDVALEVAQQVSKVHDMSWLFKSNIIEAERLLNHAKLREYWERNDPLFYTYIRADVYLTCLIARMWLYPLFVLSLLTGIPISILQSLNTGQIAEYVMTEYLRRLGYYPELRHREYLFAKTKEPVNIGSEDGRIFTRGKVYVRDYGIFGGGQYKIVELDFAQLYPTDMVSNSVDPTAIYVTGGLCSGKPCETTLEGWSPGKEHIIVLGSRTKKSETTINPTLALKVIHGYGPISFLVYKMYVSRQETKKLKKRAEKEKRPELLAPDQAVKILNNSFYGCFSKERGNLVSELASASVFWRTLSLLYDMVNYIDNELPKKLGVDVKVIYGDTDSTYILVPDTVDPKTLAEEVNKYVKSKHGELYEMSLEDVYDAILIPKQKDANAPSGKSYICIKGNAPVKIKGEFFKLNAPVAIKERLNDIYAEIIARRPGTIKELEQLIKDVLEREPLHKLFIKKSISSFVNEDDPTKLKRLNKTFHYAALYTMYLYKASGVEEIPGVKTLYNFTSGWVQTRVRVNPREVERTQRAVVTLYLPHPGKNPRRFYVYVSDDGKDVVVDHVVVDKSIVIEKKVDKSREFETGYLVQFSCRRVKMSRTMFMNLVMDAIRKDVITPLYQKLIPALSKEKTA